MREYTRTYIHSYIHIPEQIAGQTSSASVALKDDDEWDDGGTQL